MPALDAPRWDTPRDLASLEMHPSGFHGDLHLHELVESLAPWADLFLETGTNVGSTTGHVARRWPSLEAHTCEPHLDAWAAARDHLSGFESVTVHHEASPAFLTDLLRAHPEMTSRTPLCWLDAHAPGVAWPILDEMRLLSERFERAMVLVDDCRVPGHTQFGFDAYEGVACEPSYVLPSVMQPDARVVLPTYADRTSSHHPLRGVMLVHWGVGWSLPEALRDRFESLARDEAITRR
ncbi:MAG: hypothetical protein AAGK04_12565 [Planctomycetota bacterium]